MQPPVSNAYDNISYDGLGEIGGEGGGGGGGVGGVCNNGP